MNDWNEIIDIKMQRRMYVNYLSYFVEKGSRLSDLMSFDEWQNHLGLESGEEA